MKLRLPRRRPPASLLTLGLLAMVLTAGFLVARSHGAGPVRGVSASTPTIHVADPTLIASVRCERCHVLSRPTAANAGLLPSTKEGCLACHPTQRKLLTVAGVHPPFARGECTACHAAHQADQPKLLKVPAGDLCTTCHADKRKDQASPGAHPPFAQGSCLACHDPHGSAIRPTLRADVKTLCFSCHQRVASRDLGLAVQHPPFAQGSCTACHTPHASTDRPLLRAPLRDVCMSCHQGRLFRMDITHWPVAQGLCLSCHLPHASKYESLLRTNQSELCMSCHPMWAKR